MQTFTKYGYNCFNANVFFSEKEKHDIAPEASTFVTSSSSPISPSSSTPTLVTTTTITTEPDAVCETVEASSSTSVELNSVKRTFDDINVKEVEVEESASPDSEVSVYKKVKTSPSPEPSDSVRM